MPEEPKKKSIWNRLMAIMLLIVGVLIVLVLYISYFKDRTLDFSFKYSPVNYTAGAYTTKDTFASDLVVSNNYVDLEGFELTGPAERALLFETDSNSVLFAHGIYEKAYPASLTKIMTAILAIECGDMEDVVTMEAADFMLEEGSQNSNMVAGDQVTLKQLLEVMLVYSANDASNAIARHIAGSTDAFVDMMNEKAHSLGMLGTNFVNAHGLHDDDHYTCAYDVYLMLNEAMNYPLFNEIIRMGSYTLDVTRGDTVVSYYYDSTDEFLTGLQSVPEGVILWGGKTGTTPEAGANIALIAQDEDGIPYISVVMNADKKTILYEDMSALLACINEA
jgi:D-alanyl-D-alanine carboxypeptidase (penicillin-binding protein 5/6)